MRTRPMIWRSLVIDEEKCFVALDSAAENKAELVAAKDGFSLRGGREKIAGV